MPDVLHGRHLASVDHPYRGLVVSSPTMFTDHRGALSVLEHNRDLGFVARRTFFIAFAPGGADGMTRAEHATSCNQMLVVLRGRMRLDLDNGTARHSVTATPLSAAFLVAAGVWRRIVALEPDTLLMVLADASYADTQYYRMPMPELIEANARVLSQ